MLSWDVIVLNGYLLLNLTVASYLLYRAYRGKDRRQVVRHPVRLLQHRLGGQHPHRHGLPLRRHGGAAVLERAILAPAFLASAFSSGPALMIILFQILRKTTAIEIKDEAIWTVAELMVYAMFINLFLLGAEIFKEFYSGTEHLLFTQYLCEGIGEYRALVPYAWLSRPPR